MDELKKYIEELIAQAETQIEMHDVRMQDATGTLRGAMDSCMAVNPELLSDMNRIVSGAARSRNVWVAKRQTAKDILDQLIIQMSKDGHGNSQANNQT